MLTLEQRLTRAQARVHELSLWKVRSQVRIEGWKWDGQPLQIGDAWPEREGVHHLTCEEVRVPNDWNLDESFLHLNVGGESLLGLEYGGETERFGLNAHHEYFPLLERTFSVHTESVARFEFGVPNPDPRLEVARLEWRDSAVDSLVRLLSLTLETAGCVPNHEVAPLLIKAAERAVQLVELPSHTPLYTARTLGKFDTPPIWNAPDVDSNPPGLSDEGRESVRRAQGVLEEDLAQLRTWFPKVGKLCLTGHAHLDLAWLWPLDESKRKARRTATTQLALMRRYPEFRFNQSSAQWYAWLEDDPDLFGEIRAAVQRGQWEVVGGMWVEPDMNLPAGESVVRQLLYGQRYFEQHFGVTCDTGWLPDCFGFSGAVPQLLRGAGVRNFFTAKLNWNETTKFPHDLFWWEGLDGSRVLTHTLDNKPFGEGYNGIVRPESLLRTWGNFRGKTAHRESLFAAGWGDGGGGPTPEMLEDARAMTHLPIVPEATWGNVSDFFERARESAEREQISLWQGEMYLEFHRGTYTSQERTKTLHRRAEVALTEAEMDSSLAYIQARAEKDGEEEGYPASLETAWHTVLLIEFHDILPGTSIREVYEEVEPLLEKTLEEVTASLPPTEEVHLETEQEVQQDGLENDHLRAAFSSSGQLTSLLDKRAERELLNAPSNALWVYPDKPRRWDAWDVEDLHAPYSVTGEQLHAEYVEVIQRGLAVHYVFRDSRIVQIHRLVGRRLEVHTDLEWHERRHRLDAVFGLRGVGQVLTGTAFGYHTRSPLLTGLARQAQFEVPMQGFAALLGADGYASALLASGRYGLSTRSLGRTELALSLLRSPVYPDSYTDEGAHTFRYALTAGHFTRGEIHAELAGLENRSTSVLEWLGLDERGALELAALKRAEDGDGLIVRFAERFGLYATPPQKLEPRGWRAQEVDLLERELETTSFDFSPFQVRSYRLTKDG